MRTAKYLDRFLLITLCFGLFTYSTRTSRYNDANLTDMKGFTTNIERATLANTNFRQVLYTAGHLQLVLMSLLPGEEIGAETHAHNDQFFRFEGGTGKCVIDGNEYDVTDGDVVIIPAGAKHNIINTHASTSLKMYTIYAPPHHKDGIIRATKKEAENNEAEFDGKTTE